MKSSSRPRRVLSGLTALCSIAVISGCTLSNQEAPPLAGPSGFALSLEMTAAPQVLPRDGNSTSTITVTIRNADGTPRANQRVSLRPDFGTLAFTDALTGPNGTVSVVYTAPGINVPVDTDTIRATPVEAGDAANNTSFNGGSVRIQVVGPSIPAASFTISNTTPAVLEAVTFDASASTLGGSACSTACTYTWDYGDGSNNIGSNTKDIVVQHAFQTSGAFTVTLTVTSPSGTSGTVSKSLVVSPPAPPVAEFDAVPASPTAPANVTFDASRSSVGQGATIAQYVWTFGDGSSGATTSTPAVSHSYGAAGSYNVTLYVIDNLGRRSTTKVVTLTVN
jgi:PKD repeat protein